MSALEQSLSKKDRWHQRTQLEVQRLSKTHANVDNVPAVLICSKALFFWCMLKKRANEIDN